MLGEFVKSCKGLHWHHALNLNCPCCWLPSLFQDSITSNLYVFRSKAFVLVTLGHTGNDGSKISLFYFTSLGLVFFQGVAAVLLCFMLSGLP